MNCLILTLGDPRGIGIEGVSRVLAKQPSSGKPVVIIGSKWQWDWQRTVLGYEELAFNTSHFDGSNGLWFVDIDDGVGHLEPERLSDRDRGEIAVRALEKLDDFSNHDRLAVLTSPINKSHCRLAGFDFTGQTEFFGSLWGGLPLMVLAGPKLRVGLVTNHLPINEVSSRLSVALVFEKLNKFVHYLSGLDGSKRVRVGVTGLNPHASDGGMFGDEEDRIILPAIEKFRAICPKNVVVEGPLSADTSFYRAYNGGLDGVLAMYHDQGLGPLKLAHFYDAVNVSAGLKHFRVSPDHGPAEDLFLSGKANFSSFMEALRLANNYLERGDFGAYRGSGGQRKQPARY